jgi:hypothetical protein
VCKGEGGSGALGNGSVVNTQTLDQRFLFNFPEIEQETTTQSGHSTENFKTGDIGELHFDAECARLNLAPFRPALTNGAIDRLLLLPNGEVKKIHIKASVLRNIGGKYKGVQCSCFGHRFHTKNSIKKADYYFCVGLNKDYSVSASWWIPWSIRDDILITSGGTKYECYVQCPFSIQESEVMACP